MSRGEYLGCGANGCVVERPRGPGTNGGCKCLLDLRPDRRVRVRKRLLDLKKLLHEIDTHADIIRASYRSDPGP